MLFEPLTKDFIEIIRDEIKELKIEYGDSISPS